MTSKFNLTPINASEGAEANFGAGRAEIGGRPIIIELLKINERRVILTAQGDTREARAVLSAVLEQLKALDARNPSPFLPEGHLIDREESVLVQQLSFDWTALLSDALSRFIATKLLPAASEELGEARIAGVQVNFDIRYQAKDGKLAEAGIEISPKKFAVETRAGSGLGDNLYYTISPTDAARHQSLLEDLERSLKKAK
jgi:hypothetical protein